MVKTVGQLEQQLEDHLKECSRNALQADKRMGRIEGILIAVAGTLLLTLMSSVVTLSVAVLKSDHPVQAGMVETISPAPR